MKNSLFLIFSCLAIAACGNKGGGSSDNSTPAVTTTSTTTTTATPSATTPLGGSAPLSTTCLSTTYVNGTTTYSNTCNNTLYNNYMGWQAYPVNYSYRDRYYYQGVYRFCNCPVGTLPVYNGDMGLGCVATNYIPANIYSNMYQWNLGQGYSWSFTLGFSTAYPVQTSNGMVNMNQISNTQGYPANGNNCYGGLAQACYVDRNDCGNGATCVATSGGSRLGICASANGSSYYSGSGAR